MRRAVSIAAAALFGLRALAAVLLTAGAAVALFQAHQRSIVGALAAFFLLVALPFLLPIAVAFAWAAVALLRRRPGWRSLATRPLLASLLFELVALHGAHRGALGVWGGAVALDVVCLGLLVADQAMSSAPATASR